MRASTTDAERVAATSVDLIDDLNLRMAAQCAMARFLEGVSAMCATATEAAGGPHHDPGAVWEGLALLAGQSGDDLDEIKAIANEIYERLRMATSIAGATRPPATGRARATAGTRKGAR